VVAPVVADQLKMLRNNPELARIADAWPMLPAAVRAGIMAMIDTAEQGE